MTDYLSAVRDTARSALDYVRTHKRVVSLVSVVAVSLIARFVPSLPADDILRTVASLLSAV